jgi:hypothetical protein
MRGKSFLKYLEFFLLFLFLLGVYGNGIKKVAFQPDESQWISTSAVFEAYVSGDIHSPLWDSTYWNLTQPQLARYVIGVGRRLGGLDTADLNAPWDYQKDYAANTAECHIPSEQLLWWSRLPMIFLEVLSVCIGFVLLKRIGGRTPAYLWVGLCLLSRYLPQMLGRAMGESTLLVCTAGCIWLSTRLLQVSDEKPQRLYLNFIFLAIFIGLAESAKLNGLAVLAAGFALAGIAAGRLKQNPTLKLRFGLISVLILIFVSQFTFLVLNPFLWNDPLKRISMLFFDRINEMHFQQIQYPAARLEGLVEHVQVEIPRIFQNYASLRFTGAVWLNLALCLIGVIVLGMKAIGYLKGRNQNQASLAVLLVGAAVSIPSLFTPLDWDRYYLFPVYFSTISIALGMGWLISFIYGSIQKKSRQTGKSVDGNV